MFSSLLLFVAACQALPATTYPAHASTSNSKSSLTILYQNNLNGTDDVNHIGAILLDALPVSQAAGACGSLSEHLLSRGVIEAHENDFFRQLSYLVYDGRESANQQYLIQGGTVQIDGASDCLSFHPTPHHGAALPVLCTQSSNQSQPTNSFATPQTEITVASGGNQYVGYRNKKSWRFSGMRYADIPQRWHYSSVYSGTGQTINATAYGPECPQYGAGSEDCLFANIFTSYLPRAGSRKKLKPVLFWIHGGGFNSGVSSSPLFDGGNLASREDIVVVSVNYRLSTLGFLAVPGTNITGNYGIGDQITGLQWTIENIANFGGDPNQITIFGSSAGAGSVRVLLGSPPAIGKFQGGIAQSNLGGGVDLGKSSNYATSYSSYLTIAQSYAIAGQQIFQGAGCNQTTLAAQISCLEKVDPIKLVDLPTVADKVVQDGKIVNTEQLIVSVKNGSTAHVPVIFGTAANDGASFSSYQHANNITSELQGIEYSLGISEYYAQSIINSGLFPYYDTGNITLDSFNVSQRVATDNQFRCVDEATVYAGTVSGAFERAYYYQSQRTGLGYDPNMLGGPPATPEYPNGDPNLPYFRTHGSDQAWSFANVGVFRDPADLYSEQLESGYYASFTKTGDPNPPIEYVKVRGYENTLRGIEESGPWEPVGGLNGPIKVLDFPSVTSGFIDVPQCAFLNYSLTYYLDGGV